MQDRKKNIKFNTKEQPGIRDELDNGIKEEQDFNGSDIAHCKKYQHGQPKNLK